MHDHRSRHSATRTILFLYALAFLGFGIPFLFVPEQLATLVGIRLTSSSALADLRAVYGGVSIGLGIVFALALRDPRLHEPSLLLALICTAGPALSRLYSIAVSGMPNGLELAVLAFELVALVLLLPRYRAANADTRAHDRGSAQTAR